MYIYPYCTNKTEVILLLSYIGNPSTGKIILMFRHYSEVISASWRLNKLKTRLFDKLIIEAIDQQKSELPSTGHFLVEVMRSEMRAYCDFL